MDKITIIERIKKWIASIAWNLFIWGSDFTEEEYWQRIYEQEKAYLERASEDNFDYSAALPLHSVINWVACSDRLPEGAMGSYLVCLENDTIHQLQYSDLTQKWWHLAMGDIKEHNHVKYWAELPEPPCL